MDCSENIQLTLKASQADDTSEESAGRQKQPSRVDVWKMFDRIASRYDLLNHLLSANRDRVWRKRVARFLSDKNNQRVLDLATGTADQLLALYDTGRVARGVGIDLADEMLAVGRKKIAARNLDDKLILQRNDAGDIPFDDAGFDAVTIAFGIRNMTDVGQTLSEMRRVLFSGGQALILEFSWPKNRVVRALHRLYMRHILPHLGGAISGDSEAYRYLDRTVETFPHGEAFCQLMRQVGFEDVRAHPLTFGIATIYRGCK